MVENLNVIEVPLKGKNLIEASAGTGKTYSIAIMTVRLVIEQSVSLEKILLVTFTEKAVAELQIRVRKFIKEAHDYTLNPITKNIDGSLKAIVDKDLSKAKQNLSKAVLELDNINIFTIHGFCQRTLTQYAFYTNEPFDKELVTDISQPIMSFSKDFIRSFMYPLNLEDVTELLEVYSGLDNPEQIGDFIMKSKVADVPTYDEFIDFYETSDFSIGNKKIQERIADLKSNPRVQQVLNLFHDLKKQGGFQKILDEHNIVTFDDLIINLHKNSTEELIKLFEEKYLALFIDEFQDTDQLQYEIFTRLFKTQTIFFIGDPKQAIYSFRNADINTYFRAKKEVSSIYNLDTNYRSTQALVDAVNELFDPSNEYEGLNPFYFPVNEIEIEHTTIKANNKNANYLAFYDQIIEKPFYVNNYSTLENIADNILDFLNNSKHKGEPVLPNQIAVLARGNEDLSRMKLLLAEKKIPSVIISDQKIFETEESHLVHSIIKAITTRSIKDIKSVFNFVLFNISLTDLKKMDYTDLVAQFFDYHNLYHQYGLYDTLMQVFHDLDIEYYCKQNIKNDVQFWANLNQIAEQLQYIQTQEKWSLEEVLIKMKLPSFAGEELYQTRIESDEKAVQLLTIHKSKGLEFDYVFTTNLNFGVRTNFQGFFKYYNPRKASFQLDLSLGNMGYLNPYHVQGIQQEYRRLIYVVVTRAKYGTFIYTKENKRRPFGAFMALYGGKDFQHIASDFPFQEHRSFYNTEQLEKPKFISADLRVVDKNWRTVSFSSLNYMHEYIPIDELETTIESSYDQFVFKDLTKGANTGNLIHNIFEYIDFNNQEQWESVISKSVTIFDSKKLDLYRENLVLFINHILKASISFEGNTFKLVEIATEKKINEMEFNLQLNGINTDKLNALSNKNIELRLYSSEELKGMLNGLIDLVFEHNNKFYILDWKTNYLGNTLEHYNSEGLQKAMTQNNYHLQYCIYSVALKKHLELKIPDFDYETHFGGVIYLFVRGMRQNTTHGVFTNTISQSDMKTLELLFY